jgi:hypothetical protein
MTTLIKERQIFDPQTIALINDRDLLRYSADLAGRQTLQGRPEQDAWSKGQIGVNVAQANVYDASFLPTLTGGADPGTTVTGNQSFVPVGGSVTGSVVTNVDYRSAIIPVASTTGYAVGDKIKFVNGSTDVNAIGLDDKTNTGQAMVFSVVSIVDATHLEIWPKPIALNDPALTTLQAQYSNIDTQILNGALVTKLNTFAGQKKVNLAFTEDSVKLLSGALPMQLLSQFQGNKVIEHRMDNGMVIYMVYWTDAASMQLQFKILSWWGINVVKPNAAGLWVNA